MQQFSVLDLCWNTLDMHVSVPSVKLNETQQLALALLPEAPCYSLSGYVLFGQDHLLYQCLCTMLLVVTCDLV